MAPTAHLSTNADRVTIFEAFPHGEAIVRSSFLPSLCILWPSVSFNNSNVNQIARLRGEHSSQRRGPWPYKQTVDAARSSCMSLFTQFDYAIRPLGRLAVAFGSHDVADVTGICAPAAVGDR
jgi:hypothetical protein